MITFLMSSKNSKKILLIKHTHFSWSFFKQALVEEVPQNMFSIPSAKENIIIEVLQNILIYTFSATFPYNGIPVIILFKAPSM